MSLVFPNTTDWRLPAVWILPLMLVVFLIATKGKTVNLQMPQTVGQVTFLSTLILVSVPILSSYDDWVKGAWFMTLGAISGTLQQLMELGEERCDKAERYGLV